MCGVSLVKWVKASKKKYEAGEVKRYLGVLSGQHRHDIKAIGEQYFDIKKTLDSHTKILDLHTETLKSHSNILNSHTEMIAQLMIDMTEVKNELKTKINVEQFARLEKRVVRLESKSH